MKVLFIDNLSLPGHKVFNKIHAHAFLEIGADLLLVGRKGQFDNIEHSKHISSIEVPEWCYNMGSIPSLSFRLQGLFSFLWIKHHINLSLFDYVVILTYDVISLLPFHIKGKVFLINHNNVDQLDNPIKLFLTRHISHSYTHVALNVRMMERLLTLLPKFKVNYVPHGYLPANPIMQRPSMIGGNEKFIFCPVNRNYDIFLMNNILHSSYFNEYLRKNDIYLYVKPNLLSESKGNIRVINRLDNDEYNFMIRKSLAILLPYGIDFKYRCSGILFECMSSKTPIVATNIEALRSYKDDINIIYFNDAYSLSDAIRCVREPYKGTYNIEKYNPAKYWKDLLIK